MKKTFVKVVAAAAIVLGLASCDQITKGSWDPNGENWPSFKSEPTKTADADKGKVILVNTDDIKVDGTWCVWTDENGLVIDAPKGIVNADGNLEFKFTPAQINQVDLNKEGGEARPHSERFVLYIGLTGKNTTVKNPVTGEKDGDLKDFDARGRICVYDDAKVEVSVEKYKELVQKVGVVSIKNNEPQDTGSVYSNGDYTITEIWPLDPLTDKADTEEKMANDKIGGKYGVVEAMYFKKLDVKKGDTVKFPVKAGKQIVGLYQPKRDTPTDGKELVYDGPSAKAIATDKVADLDGDNVKEATRADIYGFADKIKEGVTYSDFKTEKAGASKDDLDLMELYAKANIATIFANMIEVEAHKEIPTVNSSSFGTYYFNHKDKVRYKAAANDYVVDVELVEASLEK